MLVKCMPYSYRYALPPCMLVKRMPYNYQYAHPPSILVKRTPVKYRYVLPPCMFVPAMVVHVPERCTGTQCNGGLTLRLVLLTCLSRRGRLPERRDRRGSAAYCEHRTNRAPWKAGIRTYTMNQQNYIIIRWLEKSKSNRISTDRNIKIKTSDY